MKVAKVKPHLLKKYQPQLAAAKMLRDKGASLDAAARVVGLTPYTLKKYLPGKWINGRCQRHRVDVKRAEEMMTLRESGMTLQVIADRFGVSRERIRQIVSRGRACHPD